MQEIIVKKGTSIILGLVFLCVAAYCLQFALLSNHLKAEPIYFIGFLMVLLLLTINLSQDIRFTGFNFIPPKPYVVLIFWVVLLSLCFAYFRNRAYWVGDSSQKARIAHLIVGLYLYAFAASSIFGSFFSGLGFRLFLKNPIVWLKYISMRSRGELE